MVRCTKPKTVLEIGIGGGVVARELSATGTSVTTVDIAEELHPDVTASVTKLPFSDNSFDVVLVGEVLEHIQYKDVPQALRELHRVACKAVVVSVPHPGYVFSVTWKLPLFHRIALFAQVPFFWEKHHFNGEHYWELGKREYSTRRFKKLAREAGFSIMEYGVYADDPAHRFFLFSV